MAMAQVRTMSLDFELADTLLSQVRPEILDKNTNLMLLQGKAALANAQGDFAGALKVCRSADADSVSKSDKPLQASFYSECAIAQAAKGQNDDAEESLKMVGKRTSKKGGFYAWTAARMADVQGKREADSLYQAAEAMSIKNNMPYMTATILYHRSLLKGTPADVAADLKLRCKNAFELMGLPNNAKRCGYWSLVIGRQMLGTGTNTYIAGPAFYWAVESATAAVVSASAAAGSSTLAGSTFFIESK